MIKNMNRWTGNYSVKWEEEMTGKIQWHDRFGGLSCAFSVLFTPSKHQYQDLSITLIILLITLYYILVLFFFACVCVCVLLLAAGRIWMFWLRSIGLLLPWNEKARWNPQKITTANNPTHRGKNLTESNIFVWTSSSLGRWIMSSAGEMWICQLV